MSSLFYRKLGKGYPIILIHGFCETHEIWSELANGLSRKFEVFIIDLPGFGNSPLPPTPFSIDDVATQVSEWIDQLKIIQPIVFGHSLGGYVTLAMAKKHADKFAGLGLIHSTAFPDPEEKKANRNKVIDFVNTYGTSPFIDTFVPGLFFDTKHPAIPVVDKIARETPKETLLSYTAAMRDRPSSVDFIKDYKKPILILGGDRDTVIPAEVTLEHGRLTPMGQVHLIKDTGHMAMYECCEECLSRIELFVDKIMASSLLLNLYVLIKSGSDLSPKLIIFG